MPVYNTEKYIAAAIESVFKQTLTEWELLVVNDGSTDNSLHVVQQLALQDSRIILIDQPNMGVSAARNRGLKKAIGKYIYFLDSDDEIIPDTLAQCFENSERYSLDFLFFDATTISDTGVNLSTANVQYSRTAYPGYVVQDGVKAMAQLLRKDEFLVSPCLIFTLRAYSVEKDFSFLEGIVHEDELYSVLLYLNASRVMYLPKPLFVRRFRANSTMTTTISRHNIKSYFTVATRLQNLAMQQPPYKAVVDLYLSKMLNAVLWKAHKMSFSDRFYIFKVSIDQWYSYITFRSWLVLLFKKYIPSR